MKILTHPQRRQLGIAASYRLGLQHCGGKYIAFLEQDDMWPGNKISEQIKILEAFPKVGVVFSDIYEYDDIGKLATEPFVTRINRPPSDRSFNSLWRLLWGNYVSTFSNMMVREELVHDSDILSYPEGFQDWMLLLKLSFRCKFYHCTEVSTIWRQRSDSHFSTMKRMPGYRKKRKLAIKRAVTSVLNEQESFHRKGLSEYYSKIFLRAAITLLSAIERLADFMNRKVTMSEQNHSYAQSSSKYRSSNEGLQTEVVLKESDESKLRTPRANENVTKI